MHGGVWGRVVEDEDDFMMIDISRTTRREYEDGGLDWSNVQACVGARKIDRCSS